MDQSLALIFRLLLLVLVLVVSRCRLRDRQMTSMVSGTSLASPRARNTTTTEEGARPSFTGGTKAQEELEKDLR
jgi:hypothetical protein